MISLIRLDERLIHGQVAIKWSRHTGVDRIVVIDEKAANNPIIQKSLMMAAPNTVKVAIKSVDSGIKLLQDPRCEAMKILIIVSDIKELNRVLENVKGIPLVNIGNYGRVAPKRGLEERKRYRSNLYLYDDEAELLKKTTEYGIETIYQTVPDDSPEKLVNVLA